MKRIILFYFLIIISSCQKPDSIDSSQNLKSENAIIEFEKSKPNFKRSIFNTLSSEEKLTIWKKSLDGYLNMLTQSSKREAIIELKSLLNSKIFEENNKKDRGIFLNQTLPKWRDKYKANFTIEDFNEINNLPLKSEFSNSNNKGAKISSLDCDCTRGNPYDCSNTLGTLRCAKTICGGSYFGCGDLWLQNCNGLCSYTPIIK